MRDRVADVTRDLVLVPTGREIAQYEHFRKELAVASAVLSRSPRLPGTAERTVRRTPSVRDQVLRLDLSPWGRRVTCREWPSRRS
jgi:hypothetical protein